MPTAWPAKSVLKLIRFNLGTSRAKRLLLRGDRLDQRVHNLNCSVALSCCQIFAVEDRRA